MVFIPPPNPNNYYFLFTPPPLASSFTLSITYATTKLPPIPEKSLPVETLLRLDSTDYGYRPLLSGKIDMQSIIVYGMSMEWLTPLLVKKDKSGNDPATRFHGLRIKVLRSKLVVRSFP